MPTYHLLIHPSANRVYARDAAELAVAEVRTVTDLVMPGRVSSVAAAPLGRATGVAFTTAEPLTGDDLRIVSTCASALVLFEVDGALDGLEDAAGAHLTPVGADPLAAYPDDLLTTLKYAGKTNEQFTALMVNLALAASRRGFGAAVAGEPVRLLDPLCGRGTTLNQALYYGLDAVGIESRDKETDAYLGFIRQWLRDNRLKHRSESRALRRGPDRDRAARHVTVTIAAGPAGDRPVISAVGREQRLEVVTDDTLNAGDHVRGSSVDLVVGDLPYGVQHEARAGERGGSRNPVALLDKALPVWRRALRGGGALCLAYNTNILGREEADAAVVAGGFTLVDAVTDGRFAHRVDRAIRRDLTLAVKPG